MRLHSKMTLSVILPPQPGKVESFAGEELQKYLQQIFGKQISFEAASADVTVVIGRPERNPVAQEMMTDEEFAKTVPGPEGFLYQIKNNTLWIAGSEGTGILYGVYTFLEQVLGCCFGAFPLPDVPAGETVPTYTQLELEDTRYCKAAADLPYRTSIAQFNEWVGKVDRGLALPFIDYLAKNRYNRILTWVGVYKEMVELGLVEELEKRGIRLTVGHHQSLATFMPFEGNEEFPTPYGKEHPEFFRVLPTGRRQTSIRPGDFWGQWLLCSRSKGCIEEMAANINAWLERNPVVDTIALWPNDGVSRQCQCGLCARHTKMENYLYFMNEVAKRLREAHEERKIDVIIYLDLWNYPKGTQLCENVVVDIATWTPKGLRHCGKPDGSALLESFICENMHAYRNAGSRVVLYEYYMGNYGNKQAVMPAADEMQSIFRYFRKHGFDGSGTQMECFNLWNNILNFYCFARTAYDTELSLEQAIKEISRLFGAGAVPICEVFRIYEQTLDGQVSIDRTGKLFAQIVDAPKIYELFEDALKREEKPLFRNNIRLLRMAFHYTMLLQENTPEAEEEKGVMATFFDSFHVNDPGYGIAIVSNVRIEQLPEDKWYQFET